MATYPDNSRLGWREQVDNNNLIVESWSQGFMVGGLTIMAGLTVANMGRRILHKLILLELLLAMPHGTFCFTDFNGYGWYVSTTAMLCYSSWYLHNIIAWIKNKPFLSPRMSTLYIGTVILVAPYWILESYANFAYHNHISDLFKKTRILEPLFRDPWWIFTCCNLVWNIKTRYSFGLLKLIQRCPRFGVMLVSMVLSIIFLLADLICVILGYPQIVGLDPYWKLSLVFKCFCDMIILDDFRSALDKLRAHVFDEPALQGPPNVHQVQPSPRRQPSSSPQHYGYSGGTPSMKPITLVYSGANSHSPSASMHQSRSNRKYHRTGNGKTRIGKMPRIPFSRSANSTVADGGESAFPEKGVREKASPYSGGQIYVSTDVTLEDDSSSSEHQDGETWRNPYNTWPTGSRGPRKVDMSEW
ncbi:MAG: hypothetical protein M1833_005559 [Piccolia ochrophora]|nr:MAG: hypothetical protein M1833_005559 [Piccolia ochrophora]